MIFFIYIAILSQPLGRKRGGLSERLDRTFSEVSESCKTQRFGHNRLRPQNHSRERDAKKRSTGMHPEHGKEERTEEEMTASGEAVIAEALNGQAAGNEDEEHKKKKESPTGSQSAGSSVDDESAESKRKKVWRVMLTPEQAKGIYLRRPSLDEVCFAPDPLRPYRSVPLRNCFLQSDCHCPVLQGLIANG